MPARRKIRADFRQDFRNFQEISGNLISKYRATSRKVFTPRHTGFSQSCTNHLWPQLFEIALQEPLQSLNIIFEIDVPEQANEVWTSRATASQAPINYVNLFPFLWCLKKSHRSALLLLRPNFWFIIALLEQAIEVWTSVPSCSPTSKTPVNRVLFAFWVTNMYPIDNFAEAYKCFSKRVIQRPNIGVVLRVEIGRAIRF